MAVSNPLKLAIDRQNQTLANVQGFATKMPVFCQGDVKDLIVQVYDPGGLTSAPVAIDYTGYVLRVVFGTAPTGNTPSTQVAWNFSMAWNAANSAVTGNAAGYFSGSIDFTQAALATAIGNLNQAPFYLQFDVRLNGVTQTLWQTQAFITAVVDSGITNTTPSSANTYYTKAEMDALFAKLGPVNGKRIYFNSDDGAYTGVRYLGTDGTWHDEILTSPLPPIA